MTLCRIKKEKKERFKQRNTKQKMFYNRSTNSAAFCAL